jgi:hypothetical protein
MHDQPTAALIWGQAAIGCLIGRDARCAGRLLRAGLVPAARKLGCRWAVPRNALLRAFESAAV